MLQKKNILKKIVKKDYNNELERILEEKNFDENVKSTLLSILYKIETSYKDFETVKKSVESKDEYISKFLNIINNECNSIKILNMNSKKDLIPENKTYIINKEKKEIIAYPIERKILYAISKMGKKDNIIKDKYVLINETISELINVGNCINMVEPLRDFNGYSWTCLPQEIESIDHNLIYQNLLILVGHKILNKWVDNSEFLIDYFELFQDELEKDYGKENKKKIIDLLSNISILLSIKFNKEKKEYLILEKKRTEEELQKIEDRQEFIEEKTNKKIEISKKIKKIDTIVNDKKLLEKEYDKRNEKLPLEKKIFSMKILSKMMEEERKSYLKELEEINDLLNPKNFIKYKKELEVKYKYLKILDVENKEKEMDRLKLEFQKLFLNLIEINVNKAETKQDIEKIIYYFRYYLLISYNGEKQVFEIEQLQSKIKKISNLIIEKAIELKVIEKVSNDKKTNYEILKNIFYIRIIELKDAYLKIIKEKDKYYAQIFDENIFEEKIEISKPKDLIIKLNKKISMMEQ